MSDRTIKVYGYTGEEGATFTYSFNGTEVFNGSIDATGSSEERESLFEFTISTDVSGNNIPSTLSVTSGTICIVMLSANYSSEISTEQTLEDGTVLPAVTVEDLPNLYNFMDNGLNTSSSNWVLDGETVDSVPNDTAFAGAFHNVINANQTFTADWVIDSAITS